MLEWLKDLLFAIANNELGGEYSKEWDIELNKLMDQYEFVYVDFYTYSINGINIEVPNNLHFWGQEYFNPCNTDVRPSIKTLRRGKEIIAKTRKKHRVAAVLRKIDELKKKYDKPLDS